MELVKYAYEQTEQQNLTNLLKAGGYPEEHIPDVVISDYTADGENGRASFTASIPNAEHPLYPLMGNKTSVVHTFKRAHVVEKETATASMDVKTPMHAYDPEAAIKTKFGLHLAQNVVVNQPTPFNPAVHAYVVKLQKPVTSNLIKGEQDVNVTTTMSATVMVGDDANSSTVFVNPYAPVTTESNGKPTTVPEVPRDPGNTNKVFLVGEVDNAPVATYPFMAFENVTPNTTPEIATGMLNRFKGIINAKASRFIPTSNNDEVNGFKTESFLTYSDEVTDEALKNFVVSSGVMSIPNATIGSNIAEMATADMTETAKMWFPVMNYNVSVKHFLFGSKPVTLGIRSARNPSHVKPSTLDTLLPAWFTQAGEFNEDDTVLTFDMSAVQEFTTLEDFQTAVMESVKDAFTVGNYTPTFTMGDSNQVGGLFTTTVNINSTQSSAGAKPYAAFLTGGLTVTVNGKQYQEPVEEVTIDLIGFDEA